MATGSQCLPLNSTNLNFTKVCLGGSDGKESESNAEDLGSIPVPVRSPGEGNGNLQYSYMENSMDRGAW